MILRTCERHGGMMRLFMIFEPSLFVFRLLVFGSDVAC